MKKIKWWKGILLLLVAALAVTVAMWKQIPQKTEEEDQIYMTQAYAMKAAACLLADVAVLPENEILLETVDSSTWYEPYVNYLQERGYW